MPAHAQLVMRRPLECRSDVSGAEGNDQSTLDIAYSQRDRRMIELLTTKGGQVGWYAKTAHVTEKPVDITALLNSRIPLPSRVIEEESTKV